MNNASLDSIFCFLRVPLLSLCLFFINIKEFEDIRTRGRNRINTKMRSSVTDAIHQRIAFWQPWRVKRSSFYSRFQSIATIV